MNLEAVKRKAEELGLEWHTVPGQSLRVKDVPKGSAWFYSDGSVDKIDCFSLKSFAQLVEAAASEDTPEQRLKARLEQSGGVKRAVSEYFVWVSYPDDKGNMCRSCLPRLLSPEAYRAVADYLEEVKG